ncbi:phosphotransferase enzyme family protein [Penicillium sp. IBT 31633x]|nr:phosphotransferase enzyme family protein [Penicillium sp. IBT 31633x]
MAFCEKPKDALAQATDVLRRFREDGWVRNEDFEEVVRKCAELEASLIATAEGDQEDIDLLKKGWPFRDREEID